MLDLWCAFSAENINSPKKMRHLGWALIWATGTWTREELWRWLVTTQLCSAGWVCQGENSLPESASRASSLPRVPPLLRFY